jgi:uncharacterized membrane protein YkvA (DUF1232 family)
MLLSQLRILLKESGTSPEQFGQRIELSGMTLRRLLKKPDETVLPESYEPLVRKGVYSLILEGRIKPDSQVAQEVIRESPNLSFAAAIHALGFREASMEQGESHPEKVLIGLSEIGASPQHQSEVQRNKKEISRFRKLGKEWSRRVTMLGRVIKSRELTQMEKLSAYGALFYLITVFDLIPDTIPVFGVLDDFAVLGIVVAYYLQKFPELFRLSD